MGQSCSSDVYAVQNNNSSNATAQASSVHSGDSASNNTSNNRAYVAWRQQNVHRIDELVGSLSSEDFQRLLVRTEISKLCFSFQETVLLDV